MNSEENLIKGLLTEGKAASGANSEECRGTERQATIENC